MLQKEKSPLLVIKQQFQVVNTKHKNNEVPIEIMSLDDISYCSNLINFTLHNISFLENMVKVSNLVLM